MEIVDIPASKNGVKLKAYTAWKDMFRRCYSNDDKYRNKSYSDCTVCQSWHVFSKFKEWHDDNYVEGWFLDKDLINPSSRVYSPETCCYVPRILNNILVDQKGKKSTGSYYEKDRGTYRASLTISNKTKFIGRFKTNDEAVAAYKAEKSKYVISVLDELKKSPVGTDDFFALLESIRLRYLSTNDR